MIGHVDTPSNGQPTIGKPFYGQAKGQLRLTCAFYAECAHEGAKGAEGSKGCGGRLWRGRDRDRDRRDAFQYSRRLTRPYGREG